MPRFIAAIPRIVVSLLLVAAIVNLLIGVFLRYVMIEVTDWLDVDPIRDHGFDYAARLIHFNASA